METKSKLVHDEQREKDVQSLCNTILCTPIKDTGDYGKGGECPFCYASCWWNDEMEDVQHKNDCAYLIAKDLSTL